MRQLLDSGYVIPHKDALINTGEMAYLSSLVNIRDNGLLFNPEGEIPAYSIPSVQLRFTSSEGFPILTSKRVFYRGAIGEMLWIMKGDTNIKYLLDNNIHIWDNWANKDGETGPIYPAMMRHYPSIFGGRIDQLAKLVNGLVSNPLQRSHKIDMWRPDTFYHSGEKLISIKPCHTQYQVVANTARDNNSPDVIHLHGILNQRSCDMFLGVPFNIIGYFFLTRLLTYHLNNIQSRYYYTMDTFVWHGNDCHLYHNSLDVVNEQLEQPLQQSPSFFIKPAQYREHLWDYELEDFTVENYNPKWSKTVEVSLQGSPAKGKAWQHLW